MVNKNEVVASSADVPSAARIQANVNMIKSVMDKVMKKDVHYGVIPGCKKPSLYKPGAEKIMATFRLVAENPIIEDLSTPDSIRYRVTQRIATPDGVLVGSASGECSSDEEKYKWRRPVCVEEFNETPEDRRREKWTVYQGKASKSRQIRTNPADVANTILKMAVKRALIAAVLISTAASDVFEQDVEDLPEGILPEETEAHNGKPDVDMPQAKPAPAAQKPPKSTPAPQQPEKQATNPISEAQAKRLYAIAKGNGYTYKDVDDYLSQEYETTVRQIERESYEWIVQNFESPKVKNA
jgi:hypothetical protein